MHVDETDDPMARTLEVLAELTIVNGWQGRVTAGHTCALASYPRNYADHVICRLRQANVNMIANPATNLILQGRLDDYPKRRGVTRVKELLAAGVNVACGQDCVHDTFYPFGQNDPLEIAFLLCHASQMSQPACVQWASGTSPLHQPHLGRMAMPNGCSDRSGMRVWITSSFWARRISAGFLTLITTTASELIDPLTRMHRSLARYSAPV